MEGVLVSPSSCHIVYPLLRARYHHVNVKERVWQLFPQCLHHSSSKSYVRDKITVCVCVCVCAQCVLALFPNHFFLITDGKECRKKVFIWRKKNALEQGLYFECTYMCVVHVRVLRPCNNILRPCNNILRPCLPIHDVQVQVVGSSLHYTLALRAKT